MSLDATISEASMASTSTNSIETGPRMDAIVLTAIGGPEVLRLQTVRRPALTDPHEILVQIKAAGVNMADVRVRRRMPPLTDWELPEGGIIPGIEGAGVVTEIGPAVSRFAVGDEVYWWDIGRCYAQYKALNEDYVAHKPKTLGFAEAAALPVVLVTSWEALYDRAGLKHNEYLLVQGGAGGLGHMGVQLAKLRGAHVATTVSTQAKADLAHDLGAEHIIRYRDENVAAAVKTWSGKDGVDIIYDTVGEGTFVESFDLLATYGRLVTAAYPSTWPKAGPGIFEAALKNISIVFEGIGHAIGDHQRRVEQTAIMEQAALLIDCGKLRLVLDRTYPLIDAAKAQTGLESGEIVGRIALDVSPGRP